MTVTTVATSTELTIGYIVDGMVAASRAEIDHPDTEMLGRACRFLFEIAVNRGASLLDVAAPSGDAATTPNPGCPLRGAGERRPSSRRKRRLRGWGRRTRTPESVRNLCT
jgi:hypothetical protein